MTLRSTEIQQTPSAGAQPNKSIIDGIATLQVLATSDEPIGCRELARRLGLNATRVNRLLKTLAYLGLAHQLANRKYTAGSGMHVLAAQSIYASGLLRSAIEPLEDLQRFNRVVAFGVLWRDSVTFLYHAQPRMGSAEAIGRIGLFPATQSGVGMALLAACSEEYVREIYHNREIPGYSRDLDALLNDLGIMRSQGYARVKVVPTETDYVGRPHHTIAVTIGNPATSAIAISGWIPDQGTVDVVEALQLTKKKIEAAMEGETHNSLDIPDLSDRFRQHIKQDFGRGAMEKSATRSKAPPSK